MPSTSNLRSQIVTASSGLIERAILLIRGHKVMLDADLATLYQVSVKGLNQQVARNRDRFPEDFMFQSQFKVVFQAIRELMAPPAKPRKQIGFRTSTRPHMP